jgi:hypothetical protein
MRAVVVVLALRIPGVAIARGKSDLSEAFKHVQVLLADAFPGLEDLEVFPTTEPDRRRIVSNMR